MNPVKVVEKRAAPARPGAERTMVPAVPAPVPAVLLLRRSPGRCACGGGCPSCRAEQAQQTSVPSIAIGPTDDVFEREAEHAAESLDTSSALDVGSSAMMLSRAPALSTVQRCACGGSAPAGGTCAACAARHQEKEEKAVQRAPQPGAAASPAAALPSVHATLASSGHPLDAAVRSKTTSEGAPQVNDALVAVKRVLTRPGTALDDRTRVFMESRFGYDFSRVRIHYDEEAAVSARDVSAHAYTVGSSIVFNRGKYQPHSAEGKRLLAHELSHVVQQGEASPVVQRTAGPALQAAPVRVTRTRGGTASLQRYFLSTEPAGGCGLCYGTPANAGKAAHALIQQEFEVLYPLGLVELGVTSPDDENGRLDLAVAVPGGFEIGEIKPANEKGYESGILQLARYVGLIQERFPTSTIKPLKKLLPPAIFPTLSPACPVQALFVNPPVGGVYGYYCQPSFAQLLRTGRCSCPPPRLTQRQQEEAESKTKQPSSARQTAQAGQPAKSPGERILDFIRTLLSSGASVEESVTRFLRENPDIVENIGKIIAGIAALDIASDILSGGAGISKDPVVVAILTAMLRIARTLRAAAPLLALPAR